MAKTPLKQLIHLETVGFLFVFAAVQFLRHLYPLSHRQLIGILFGSVNGSIWEQTKPLLLAVLLWGLLELLCVTQDRHRLAVIRTAAVFAAVVCSLLCSALGRSMGLAGDNLPITLLSIAAASAVTLLLYRLPFAWETLFLPAVFLLFLFLSLFFSFTPFPPQHPLFEDPATGLYGIIPTHIDIGAAVLSGNFGESANILPKSLSYF